MPIFRKPRRTRPLEGPPASEAGLLQGERRGATEPRLEDRLREIAATVAPEDAFAPALEAILDASRAQAGAICLYDQRYGLLRLAAEVGLSDEGCRRLRNVRRADPATWDMPLHGLLNRRAYLIESAARNRYVPKLAEPAASMRTVACVPIYAGPTPVGSLILVSLAPRSLGERDIRTIERALGELAGMIEAARRCARSDEAGPPARPAPDVPAIFAERERLRGEVAAHLAEHARLAAELAARSAENEQLRAALESAAEEQARAAAELDGVRRAAAASAAAAEGRIAELAAAAEALRGRLAAAETALEGVRARARAQEEEAERLAIELSSATARAAGAADAEAAEAALGASRAIIEALEEEAGRAGAEIERFAAAERAAGAEQERLEGLLREGLAKDQATSARLAALEQEATALRAERDRLAGAARSQTASLAARLETLAADRETLAADRDRLAAALRTAEAALARAEALDDTPAMEVERVPLEPAPLAEPAAAPPAPAPREPVRLVTVAAPGAPRARVPRIEGGRQLLAVLDTDPSWEDVAVAGHEVAVLAPGEDIAVRLAAAGAARIVVNLAAHGALGSLLALRGAGSTARFWGCLADPAGDRALALGMIEPAARPLDPDAVLAALGGYAIRGTRVVTAGSDVDALMSLRQALARRGTSVSMAWDAKQTIHLFDVVRPEVVVLDLSLPKRDGYRIAAQLGRVDPLPSAVLVPGTDDPSAGFAAALADLSPADLGMSRAELLAAVPARSEAAPVERRQRIRAVSRK